MMTVIPSAKQDDATASVVTCQRQGGAPVWFASAHRGEHDPWVGLCRNAGVCRSKPCVFPRAER